MEKEAREGPASASVVLVAGAMARRAEAVIALLATHALAETATVRMPARPVLAAVDRLKAEKRKMVENIVCCVAMTFERAIIAGQSVVQLLSDVSYRAFYPNSD